MDLGLSDAKILITGGASHIGRAIVLKLAAEGAHLVILDRDVDQAERTAGEAERLTGRRPEVAAVDVSDHAAAEAACLTAIANLGGLDVLITNVGFNRPDFFLETDPAIWDSLIATNLRSVMTCVRAALPTMIAQGHGAIVATASTAAFGEPRQGVYAAAKAGVVAFIRTIAQEYGRSGVRANLVAPGLTLPEGEEDLGELSLWRQGASVMNEAQIDYVNKATPLRRLTKADDVANSVVFLASDTVARQITGQLITVSGGFAMR